MNVRRRLLVLATATLLGLTPLALWATSSAPAEGGCWCGSCCPLK